MDLNLDADNALISELGGVTKLAQRLNYSVQRVQNWKTRGIPAEEKLKHPELFLRELTGRKKAPAAAHAMAALATEHPRAGGSQPRSEKARA